MDLFVSTPADCSVAAGLKRCASICTQIDNREGLDGYDYGPGATGTEARDSWIPMIAIALGQAMMSFNVASLPVSMGGMVQSFNVPPTTIGTGIVLYSLAVAGFVMLGAKLCQRFGPVIVFRSVIGLFGVAQLLMTFSPVATVMLIAQLLAGLAAAAIVPSLVALIAHHYHGQQQATAIGALGSARAAAGVTAFLVGGLLGTFIGWRPVFGILIVVAAIVFFLSFKLKPAQSRPEVNIDPVGVVLAAVAIILISLGFNNLNRWGLGAAAPGAPFEILGLSPAPVMIVVGIALLQSFIIWTRRRQAAGKTPLLDLRVVTSSRERAAVICMFAVVLLEAMLNFSVPLYIQIIQGRTPIETAVAMLPFNLTVFFTAMLVVRLYKRFTPRRIGQAGFALCTVALLWLAFVVRNDWSSIPVMFGLITFGIGQGALVTLVFNVLVTAAPKELAGDVGSMRGTTQNLAAGRRDRVGGRSPRRPAEQHDYGSARRESETCRSRCRARSISRTSPSSPLDPQTKCDTGYVRDRHGNEIQPPRSGGEMPFAQLDGDGFWRR